MKKIQRNNHSLNCNFMKKRGANFVLEKNYGAKKQKKNGVPNSIQNKNAESKTQNNKKIEETSWSSNDYSDFEDDKITNDVAIEHDFIEALTKKEKQCRTLESSDYSDDTFSSQNNKGKIDKKTPAVSQGPFEEDIAIGLGVSGKRKPRNITKMMDIWKQPSTKKKTILANRFNQPVGPYASNFTNFCGVVARNSRICPLSYPNWSKVPPTTKDVAFSTIEQHFEYPNELQKWVNKSVGKKWKDYKYFLKKKHYDPQKSEAENARNVPKRVAAQDWRYLVNYWKSDEGKKKAETNKRSQERQVITHTTGSKSFALARNEMEEERGGEIVGDLDFYENTHRTKDGSFLHNEAANTWKTAKTLVKERHGKTSSDPLTLQMEVLAEVRGKDRYGCVRGLGLGPTPSQVFGHHASTIKFANSNEVSELKTEVRQLRELVSTLIKQINPASTTSHARKRKKHRGKKQKKHGVEKQRKHGDKRSRKHDMEVVEEEMST